MKTKILLLLTLCSTLWGCGQNKEITLDITEIKEFENTSYGNFYTCQPILKISNNSMHKVKLRVVFSWEEKAIYKYHSRNLNAKSNEVVDGNRMHRNRAGQGLQTKCDDIIFNSKPKFEITECEIDNVPQGECMEMIGFVYSAK